MKSSAIIAGVLIQLASPSLCLAQEPGNVNAGLAYVETHCAKCHAIEEDYTESPVLNAPTFQSLANNPEITGRVLNVLLRTPHRDMPDLIIPRQEGDNIIAYILSLKKE